MHGLWETVLRNYMNKNFPVRINSLQCSAKAQPASVLFIREALKWNSTKFDNKEVQSLGKCQQKASRANNISLGIK